MAAKWTDAEKNALLVSIIAASGPVKWDLVAIPPGRTKKACLHIYDQAKKQAADHTPIDADFSIKPVTPKAPKAPKKPKATTNGTDTADATPKAKATPKRKRNTKAKGEDVAGSGEEWNAEESSVKKQKTEGDEKAAVKEESAKEDDGENDEEA